MMACTQRAGDAHAPVTLLALGMNNGYSCVQGLIGFVSIARPSLAPLEKSAAGHTQYVA